MKKAETPLVSICCITYNHEKYIKDAIEGFLMQKTSFPIEIIIYDDASTDKTVDIIKEYEAKYSELFNCMYQKENQYSKGVRGIVAKFTFPLAKGKYIALCEGDDYWTDSNKLQKQVDFLEVNPEYTMCFHGAEVLCDGVGKINGLYEDLENRDYTGHDIFPTWRVPTASVVFRSKYIQQISEKLLNPGYYYGDTIVYLTLAEYGKLYCYKKKMSIYRRQPGSITQINDSVVKQKRLKHFETIKNDFGGKYRESVDILFEQLKFSQALRDIKNYKIKGILGLLIILIQKPAVFIGYIKNKYITHNKY